MSKKMLVNATQPEENRVAIVEDGILTELDIEVVGKEQTKGNIYKATVVRVEPGLQAAFIDYGAERLGFLQMGEIHPAFFEAADPKDERKGKLRISDVLRRGQEMLVQVVKGARGTKGAALTTNLSLAGRYMVLMPESDSKGVSRKIEEDSVRKKLKSTMNSLGLPENMGFIIRTAGVDQTKEELKRDFDYLVRVYDNIIALSQKAKSPALIYKESNLVIRSIRDYFTPDIDEVLVDDPKVAQEAKDFLQQVMPECVKLVKLHQERRPIFSRYQIEEQIETISRNKVLLPSGGSIVIDRTEALVSIDVNSGKMAGEQGIEATALRTNLEAAVEAGRQLRLRDLGGLIVIDFIDMRERKHNREVEKQVKDALKNDKAKVTVGKISEFGLLEMSRQRIKDALAEGTFLPCPHCEGSGQLKSPEAQAAATLRKIQTGLAKGQIARVEAEIPHDAAAYLLNAKREELLEMERRNQIEIFIRGRADLIAGQAEITYIRREKEDELYLQPVTSVLEPLDARSGILTEETRPARALKEAPAVAVEAIEAPKKTRGRKKKVTEVETPVVEEVEIAAAPALPTATPTATVQDRALFGSLISESDHDDDIETAEPGKKKRKRKRKKKGASAAAGAVTGLPLSEDAETEEGEEDESEAGLPATEGEALATGEKKKKRKRKRKKKSAGAAATEAGEPSEATAPVSAPVHESDVEATPSDAPAKKKRKRKRKKRSGTGEGSTSTTPLSPMAAELVASLQSAAPESPEVAAETKPARRGRTPKATAPSASAEAPASEAVAAKPKTPRKKAAAPAAEATEAPAPAKRSRTKKAAEPAPSAEEAAPPKKRGRKPKAEAAE